jgi:hypothetical protein
MTSIPAWNDQGVLPAIDIADPTSANRSPYPVSMLEFAKRFGFTPERRAILRGFLEYRAEIHKYGYTNGFQWLDGSFSEDVEHIEMRPPNDIDVVTFLEDDGQPDEAIIATADPNISDGKYVKEKYRVDGYLVELNQLPASEIVSWSTYWYSMWSHRRNQNWKGYVQVELAPKEDEEVMKFLEEADTPKEQQ